MPFLSARFFLQVLLCKPFDTLDSPAHSPKPTSRQLPQIAIKFFEWSNMATFIIVSVCERELPTQSGSRLARDTIRRLTSRCYACVLLPTHCWVTQRTPWLMHGCGVVTSSVYIFTGSKTIFAKKKIRLFKPQNFWNFFLSKSVLGYYKTKKKEEKKWHGPLNH